jgi:hypothetical protein
MTDTTTTTTITTSITRHDIQRNLAYVYEWFFYFSFLVIAVVVR